MHASLPAGLVLTAFAMSAASTEPATARMAQLDVDRDHQISLKEAEPLAHLHEHFAQYDKNFDGYLNLVELVQYEALNHTEGDGLATPSSSPSAE